VDFETAQGAWACSGVYYVRRKIVGLVGLCVCAGILGGVLLAKNYIGPEIQEVIIEKPAVVIQYVHEYVEVPVERIVTKTETVEVNSVPLGFDTVEELQEWLDGKEPTFQAYFESPYTCMDYCASMIREAALDGYLLSQEGIMTGRHTAHALCKAWIDGKWVYIEPQTREIVEKDWR
jgi:hypothetical protein